MNQSDERDREGAAWQRSIWDRYPEIYEHEVDPRFAPVIEQVIRRAALAPGQDILDLGTGTGAVALRAAPLVSPHGAVLGVDISSGMLAVAQQRAAALGITNVGFQEGGAESIPAAQGRFHVVLASLSLMYAIDRAAAAREIARVMRPSGQFVAAVWAGPEHCDIVLFQQTAGRFAPSPPVPGVGPGALADPTPFLRQLAEAGLDVRVETETLGFDFDNFTSAWRVLAGVTTAQLPPQRQQEAQAAVRVAMWLHGDGPRHFRNVAQFIVGQRRASR
jgi:SAM-dependent methyltransferase